MNQGRPLPAEPEEEQRSFFRSKKFIFGLLCVLVLGFGLGAFLSFGKFWSTEEVVVPDVVGKQMTLARQILEDKKLRVNVRRMMPMCRLARLSRRHRKPAPKSRRSGS